MNAFLGTSNTVLLLNRTFRYLPEAEIMVSSPYFTGELIAKCISDSQYDLVLGNVPLVRDAKNPDPLEARTKTS